MADLALSHPAAGVEPQRQSLSRKQRRERREVRRAKQRLLNVVRARKMHKARIAENALPGSSRISEIDGRLFVGCSGWFYWHWRGEFYPAKLSTSAWFNHYAQRFRTVELNAPFYSWPTISTVRSWVRQAGRRQFVYTVKVCELITHTKRFRGTKTLIRDFGFVADLLKLRMGCLLFQLPPSFRYTGARLRAIVEQLEPHRRNVVEFRHSSWWNEQVFSCFREYGINFCSCSAPRLPDDLVKTTDEIYIRFHGTQRWYRHNYKSSELALWAERIARARPKRVWAYFNNDREGYALANARTFLRQLQQRLPLVPDRTVHLKR